MQNLVIVESPTKARTLSKYLGSKYRVEASMGHIRDLPKADLGIDIERDYEPKYVIPRDKTKRANQLKKLASEAKTLWLATDPDREGEAIAWHISELLRSSEDKSQKLKVKKEIHRVAFHEITPEAIAQAFKEPGSINLKLVDAQQARRVLDRLVGYKLSPLLWKKVKSGLSAGRVQSVALRLIVEREKEVETFKPVEYWSIEIEVKSQKSKVKNGEAVFVAVLIEKDGKKLTVKNKEEADSHLKNLEAADYEVSKVTQKEVKRYPAPPFTTSTLQQIASNKLGFTAKKTMMLAQFLYEHGLITYMRTDSLNLSPQALGQARKYIEENMGKSYLSSSPRIYKTRSKVAQEAHEAIRPTNVGVKSEDLSAGRQGLRTKGELSRDHFRLYDLIWKRMLASQMSEAVYDATTVRIVARGPANSQPHPTSSLATYTLQATGSVVKFEGWMKLYGVSQEVGEGEKEQKLPELAEGEILELLKLLPEQHFTEPPPRFNEASLIKKLEELGIGRPSTYASIISTILDRFYVEKAEKKLTPTELGRAVNDFLVKNFPDVFDYAFTARMEDELDEIARGERKWKPTIGEFYKPFEAKIEQVEETAERVKVEAEMTDKICPECGKNLQIRYGKFGKFLACSGFPECKYTESLEEKIDIPCPDCGGQVVLRRTKKGRPFYGCKNYPTCKFASWNKPKK